MEYLKIGIDWCLFGGEFNTNRVFWEILAEDFPGIKLENCGKLIQYKIFIFWRLYYILTNTMFCQVKI